MKEVLAESGLVMIETAAASSGPQAEQPVAQKLGRPRKAPVVLAEVALVQVETGER